ncbi:MAG: sulfatase-like hydrolase/transferase [Acidobacteria bacterium]|nr:sulfatase-like hydrolase/transferase [Acidobacteriota bacterium]
MAWSRGFLLVSALALFGGCSRSSQAPPPAPAPPLDNPAQVAAAARSEQAQDHLAKALALLEDGVARFPADTVLAMERAKLLVLLDRTEEALSALSAMPQDDAAVLDLRGYVELLFDDVAAAREHLTRAVALAGESGGHPAGGLAPYHLGLLLVRTGDLPQALESFRAAFRRDPRLLEAAYQAMGAAERLGDADTAGRAREDFRATYEPILDRQQAFVDPGEEVDPRIDRGEDLESRPVVADKSFQRTFPGGAGVEFACRVPAGERAVFRIRQVGGAGAGERFGLVHVAAPGLAAPWFPHLLNLPPSAGQPTTLEFDVLPASRLGRLLGHDAPEGAAFSEPAAVAPASAGTPATRPNVLLIVLDTLRADRVGSYGGRAAATPAMDALAVDGVRFARAESASNWTLPAHYSLFTGWTPAAHGIMPSPDKTRGYINPADHVAVRGSGREVMLAEALTAAGYRTAAVTENAWVSGRFGFEQGFRYYRSALAGGLPSTRAAALADLQQYGQRGPWFLFVHTYTPHQPYYAPRDYRLKFADAEHIGFAWPKARVPLSDYRRLHHWVFPATPSDVTAFRDLYDGQIAYSDTLVGSLVDELRRQGLLENTVVIATSDHGEEIFERGVFDHGNTLYEEVTRIPLVIHAPGRVPGGRVIDETVSIVDIPATILDFAGIGQEFGGGRSLRPLWEGAAQPRPAFAESVGRGSESVTACWDGNLKYVRRDGVRGRNEQLFDLAADPGEKTDVSDRRRDQLERLRALHDAHLADAAKVRASLGISVLQMTEKDIEQLKSLGYVQ